MKSQLLVAPETLLPWSEFQTQGFELGALGEKLARLCEVSVTLNSTVELEQLLQYILNTATEVLGCEAASIMLFDERRRELIFTATTSDPGRQRYPQIPVPLRHSIAGAIFLENQTLHIPDVAKDPRHFSGVGEKADFQPRSLIGAPMRSRDDVIGVLEALNKIEGAFDAADLYLLEIIAAQAAVAIRNAQLHSELVKTYDELSRVDQLKSDFMAIASHELRHPLAVILGYASFLKEEAQEGSLSHAQRVLDSALELRALVEDMTNMNMLQIGSVDITLERVSLQHVLRSVIDELASTAEAKNQGFGAIMPDDPIWIQADAGKLELVFSNLLNNAIRFTPPAGSIAVQVSCQANEAWIQVRDTGIGIPEAKLENVFKEFTQVEHHMTRRFGGMGLGLAIARGLTELHQGRIWAESKGADHGTTFTVVLPLG
jgi:signal transduction histidine kinase